MYVLCVMFCWPVFKRAYIVATQWIHMIHILYYNA